MADDFHPEDVTKGRAETVNKAPEKKDTKKDKESDIKFYSTNYSKHLLNDFCKYAIIKTIHTNHV